MTPPRGPAPKIKLCGLSRPADIAAANRLLPDYIGFVFAPGRRQVSPAQAAALRRQLSPAIPAVGVFVAEPPEEIAALAAAGAINVIQLHGAPDAAGLCALRQATGLPVWQAVRVTDAQSLLAARALPADLLVLDGGAGEGRAFDWTLLRGFPRPYFLAGGLNAGNLAAAIAAVRPYGVDVSSGAETNGKKDPAKMAALVALARAAEYR